MPTKKRQEKIDRLQTNRLKDVVVVLENLYDPHNAQAIFRSCDAFGVGRVAIICETVPFYDPLIIGKKSSASANKWLNYLYYSKTVDCIYELKKMGYQFVSTVLNEDSIHLNCLEFELYNKLAICFGNEKCGVSNTLQEASLQSVYIPMRGMVQSLNVSNTAAICL